MKNLSSPRHDYNPAYYNIYERDGIRRKYVSAAIRELKYSEYLSAVVAKIETTCASLLEDSSIRGNRQKHIVFIVSIYSDGTIENNRVLKSSGDIKLDEEIIEMIYLSAPFSQFSDVIRSEVDVLDMVITVKFI